MTELNVYERAIVGNADWFVGRQSREGRIDVDGDEFYGVRGDGTLARAARAANRILETQDASGAFCNFQNPDGSVLPLKSGNVNSYALLALWLCNEIYLGRAG